MIASQVILHGGNENEGETFSTAMNTSPQGCKLVFARQDTLHKLLLAR